jgi:hypothetical protein
MAARLPKSNGFDQCTIAAQSLSSRGQHIVLNNRPSRHRCGAMFDGDSYDAQTGTAQPARQRRSRC